MKVERPVGCGAFKVYKDEVAEIKRMFVNQKIAERNCLNILKRTESWAREENFKSCIWKPVKNPGSN
jgi:hypothetical protein